MADLYGGVRTRHPEYQKRLKQWIIMRDVIEGSDAIKAKKTEYLPMASSAKDRPDKYELKAYNNFLYRADFTDFTAQIKDVLHGMIENRPARMEVPNELKKKGVISNINLRGDSADQFFSDCLEDCLVTGFGGVLADIPRVDKDISVKQAEIIGIRPYLTYYKAESIINWKYRLVNGVKKLAMVVLEEDIEMNDDDFSHDTLKQWRVLRLTKDNKCIQDIYRTVKDSNGKEAELKIDSIPVTVMEEQIDYIPFIMLPFCEPVKPILYDIALLNISHYVKTADLNAANHKTALPMAYTTGHTPEVDKETGEPVPVYFGAETFLQMVESEARVGLLQFSGEGIQHNEEAIARTEAQMFTLCSHIISPDKKTAENKDAMSIHRQGEDAKLATYARYLSKRFTDAVKIICQWLNLDDDISIELNTDFSSMAFDANAVNAMANIFGKGKLPLRCLYYMLRQSNYLEPDMTYEAFVYLLDLEASSLTPTEVNEAYIKYKKTGSKIKVDTGDYYSPENLYNNVKSLEGSENQ